MAETNEQHPADIVNMALLRANSLLSTVSFCFDNVGGDFAVDKRYVASSIQASMMLIEQASEALVRLNSECDLTLIDRVEETSDEQSGEMDFSTVMQLSRENVTPTSLTPVATSDARAHTYEQLLQKVTAAEVFATAQANSTERGESMLIPILNSLKQDLMRMKSVA